MAPSKRKRAAMVGILLLLIKAKQKRDVVCRKRRIWVKNSLQWRAVLGIEEKLLTELLTEHGDGFKNFLRMDNTSFLMLHDMIQHHISKQDTQMRGCISSRLQLATTLRFLATGDSYKSLEYLIRISTSTISIFVPKVCEALYKELQPRYMKVPNTASEWLKISEEFEFKWHFPNAIGAIDGKHIQIKAPPNSGSYFFNYKGFHSVVLFAVADASAKFIYVDVGCNGRISDGGVFRNSTLYTALEEQSLNIPEEKCLPNRSKPVPYVIVGDEAFSLSQYLLKPFPRSAKLNEKQKVFNYRLSRARRIIENAFGILTARFRIFKRPICLNINSVDKVILSTCVLHNFLKLTPTENVRNFENEGQPSSIRNIEHQGSNNSSMLARSIREEFADYFYTEGQVDFQWTHI